MVKKILRIYITVYRRTDRRTDILPRHSPRYADYILHSGDFFSSSLSKPVDVAVFLVTRCLLNAKSAMVTDGRPHHASPYH